MTAQREWYEKDYYKVLGVASDASAKEITKAYHKLARDNHPDTHPGDSAAEERFKEASVAYDVLGDEARRAEYDEVRRSGPMHFGPQGGGGRFTTGNFNVGADGLGDLLGQMFSSGRRGRGSSAGTGPQRGQDLSANLTLGFADAAQGLTTTLHLTSEAQCSNCHGSGARPGSAPKVCSNCGGRGVIDDNQGFFSFSSPCRVCGGRGVTIDDPCPVCHGSGSEVRPREVQVRIPAGVADGQTIRLRGRGAPGRNGGPAGDLLVELHVQSDDTFTRDGDNLVVHVAVSFATAALGGEVSVPTLDGGSVTLRVKPGTQPGSRHRVRGRGIATKKATGDLIVIVDVEVPRRLSDAERSAIEALAAASADAAGSAHAGTKAGS